MAFALPAAASPACPRFFCSTVASCWMGGTTEERAMQHATSAAHLEQEATREETITAFLSGEERQNPAT